MRQGLMQPPTGMQDAPPANQSPGIQGDSDPTGQEGYGELGGGNASEQEQKQYENIMNAALGLIHAKQYRAKTVSRLKQGSKDIGKAIGDMALAIFSALEGQIIDKGGQVSDAVKMEVGEDIVMELVQVAVAAGLMPEDEATMDKVVAEAIKTAVGGYADKERSQGRIDPNNIQESALKLNRLTQGVQQAAPQQAPQQPSQQAPV